MAILCMHWCILSRKCQALLRHSSGSLQPPPASVSVWAPPLPVCVQVRACLQSLPQRKWLLTNCNEKHAGIALELLGLQVSILAVAISVMPRACASGCTGSIPVDLQWNDLRGGSAVQATCMQTGSAAAGQGRWCRNGTAAAQAPSGHCC